jgi:hypothetical protein
MTKNFRALKNYSSQSLGIVERSSLAALVQPAAEGIFATGRMAATGLAKDL